MDLISDVKFENGDFYVVVEWPEVIGEDDE
jgi:hypothetical protein